MGNKSERYYKCKKDYYLKRRGNKSANMKRWNEHDITLLFEFKGTDSELSKVLNRSVQAIQVKRSKVIKFESEPVSTPTNLYGTVAYENYVYDTYNTSEIEIVYNGDITEALSQSLIEEITDTNSLSESF